MFMFKSGTSSMWHMPVCVTIGVNLSSSSSSSSSPSSSYFKD